MMRVAREPTELKYTRKSQRIEAQGHEVELRGAERPWLLSTEDLF
jgi:hypothetical protein